MRKIIAGSRIHLGFYNIQNQTTMFGSIGLYLENPSTIVETGTHTNDPFVLDIRNRVCKEEINEINDPVIKSHPPRHVGLGSTTQLSLAIAKYYSLECGKNYSIEKLAELTNRGEISGIGVHGFKKGGFLIDGGKPIRKKHHVPTLVTRLSFPSEWRIIIAIPVGKKGYSESEERRIFDEGITTSKDIEKELKHTLLSKIIPGIITKNIIVFGEGVIRIQELIGKVFSPYQEGIYSTTETSKLIEILKQSGATGTGQSSWGPLAYGFVHYKQLKDTIEKIEKIIYKENLKTDIIVTKARNKGYQIINYT